MSIPRAQIGFHCWYILPIARNTKVIHDDIKHREKVHSRNWNCENRTLRKYTLNLKEAVFVSTHPLIKNCRSVRHNCCITRPHILPGQIGSFFFVFFLFCFLPFYWLGPEMAPVVLQIASLTAATWREKPTANYTISTDGAGAGRWQMAVMMTWSLLCHFWLA